MTRYANSTAALILALLTLAPRHGAAELWPQKSKLPTLVQIRVGKGPHALPGAWEADFGQGVATSYQQAPSGAFLLLVPSQGLLMKYGPDGRYADTIRPHRLGKPLAHDPLFIDFDVDQQGLLYLLDRKAGTVYRTTPRGEILGRFGQFVSPEQIEVHGRRVAVRDSATATVSVFSRKGRILWQRKGARWTTSLGSGRYFYGQTMRGDHELLILKTFANRLAIGGRPRRVPKKRRKPSIFARLSPANEKHNFLAGGVIGVDGAGNVYARTVEGIKGKAKITYIHRFDRNGAPTAKVALALWANMVMDVPRELRVSSSGRILGFQRDSKLYELVGLDLHSLKKGSEE